MGQRNHRPVPPDRSGGRSTGDIQQRGSQLWGIPRTCPGAISPSPFETGHSRSFRLTLVGHFGTRGHARRRIQLLAPLMGGRFSSVTLCRTPFHPFWHPVLAHRPRASGLFVGVPGDFAPNNPKKKQTKIHLPSTSGDRPVKELSKRAH